MEKPLSDSGRRSRERRAAAREKGRRRYTPAQLRQMAEVIERYVEETEYPILAEAAMAAGCDKGSLYEHAEFAHCIKKCTTKAEAYLARRLATDPKHVVGSIFALKQFGWADNRTVDMRHSGEVKHGVIVVPARLPADQWAGSTGDSTGVTKGDGADKSLPDKDVAAAAVAE